MLDRVGIDPDVDGNRRPREFSGGQCQRISIARALVLEPKLLVCDEIVSALDVSVQAQILNLLEDLKQEYDLTILFIAHDLAVVKNVSDRVAVMYLGRLCEIAPSDVLYEAPAHHYTAALLSSAVEPDPEAHPDVGTLAGEPPEPHQPAVGMPLPHPLPAGRGPVRRGGARAARARARATRWPATSRSGLEPAAGPPGGAVAAAAALPRPARRLAPGHAALARRGSGSTDSGRVERPVGATGRRSTWSWPTGPGTTSTTSTSSWRGSSRRARRGPLVNSPATLRWNLDKRYLRELEAAGVPVVPTTGWSGAADVDGRAAGGEVVVKPSISGGGHRTARYEPHEHDAARAHIDDLVGLGARGHGPALPSGGRRRGRARR